MSRRTRTAAVLLYGAALLGAGVPSAAQANGDHGDKRGGQNAKHHGKRHHGHNRGLARTASELGVTKEQLRTALKAVAEQQKAAAKPPSFKELLATQFGKTPDQVKAAFQQARAGDADTKDAFVAAFATALGVDPATVPTAFDAARTEQKAQRKAKRDAFVAALATQLNVAPEKVAAAFDSNCRPKHR
jgi:hypothetical protein